MVFNGSDNGVVLCSILFLSSFSILFIFCIFILYYRFLLYLHIFRSKGCSFAYRFDCFLEEFLLVVMCCSLYCTAIYFEFRIPFLAIRMHFSFILLFFWSKTLDFLSRTSFISFHLELTVKCLVFFIFHPCFFH